jgi:hypothetical protein
MNNSLARIIDGMIATVRSEIIARLDDEFARGQAYGVVDLLNNLKPRIDWLVTPLYAEVLDQLALLDRLGEILAGASPPALAEPAQVLPGAPAHEIEQLRNRLDAFICELIDWLAQRRDTLPAEMIAAAEAALKQHMQAQLKREMALTPKPLFAEIARN